jgi:hypothetical protein
LRCSRCGPGVNLRNEKQLVDGERLRLSAHAPATLFVMTKECGVPVVRTGEKAQQDFGLSGKHARLGQSRTRRFV